MVNIVILIAIVLTGYAFYLLRRDSLFSPGLLLLILNCCYLFLPIIIFYVFHYKIKDYGKVFPPLYSHNTAFFMIIVYLSFIALTLLFRFYLFKDSDYSSLNNLEFQKQDKTFSFTSAVFILIGVAFLIIAIRMVGLKNYMDYSINATIGNNVVAQSFKSQGEYMIGIFSMPVIKFLFNKKKWIYLCGFLGIITTIAFIGGARKFLVFPFVFLLVIYIFSNRHSMNVRRKISYLAIVFSFAYVLSIAQGIRDSSSNIFSLQGIINTLSSQFGFAYLVPASFVYYNYDALFHLNFSIPLFLKQLFMPFLMIIPRFIYPNKYELLGNGINHDVLQTNFHTVGGSSFIEYFLSNSIYSLIIFYPIFLALVFYIFKLNQKNKQSLLITLYLSSVIVLIWFNFNLGYEIVIKMFLMQILISVLLLYAFTHLYTSIYKKIILIKNKKKED